MNETRWWPAVGLAFGIALGFAAAFGGIVAFLIVLVLGTVGFLAGRALAGDLNLSGRLDSRRRS